MQRIFQSFLITSTIALIICAIVMPLSTTTQSILSLKEQEPTIETEPIPTEHVIADINILEDYMLPLEDHSWERVEKPEIIMIHFSSAIVNNRSDPYNIQHIRDIFIKYGVSTHYIIERDGTIHCYIPDDRIAWHAGKGEFGDDPKYTDNMNQYSIGIELIGIGSEKDMAMYLTNSEYRDLDESLKGFTEEQYDSLQLLVSELCKKYQIPMDRNHIIGHEDYSPSKTDPGELFDWSRIVPEGIG